MAREIYLFKDVNSAVILEGDHGYLLDGFSGELSPLDHYNYAQLRAIRARQQRVDLEQLSGMSEDHSTVDLWEHIVTDKPLLTPLILELLDDKANNNIDRALQLMDNDLSTEYRNNLLGLMLRDISDDEDTVFRLLYAEIYGRIVPKEFKPNLAVELIGDRSKNLTQFFTHLPENSRYVGMLNVMKIESEVTVSAWQEIEDILVENGYKHLLAESLKRHSFALFKSVFDLVFPVEIDGQSLGKAYFERVIISLKKKIQNSFQAK